MNDELTPQVVDELHAQLEETRAQLRAQVGFLDTDEQTQGRADTAESRINEVSDNGEMGADLEQIDRDAASIEVIRQQLADVEHALSKFAQGTYGLCEVCGKPIPLARLRVIPWARNDTQHQAEIDARSRRA
jgi:RNA polymerase-binding transcription factor DksA